MIDGMPESERAQTFFFRGKRKMRTAKNLDTEIKEATNSTKLRETQNNSTQVKKLERKQLNKLES